MTVNDQSGDGDEETSRIRSLDEQDKRIGNLEEGQGTILAKLDQLLGGGGKTGNDSGPGAEPKGKPQNIAEEIRAQLDARDAKAKADAETKAREDRLAAVEAKQKELSEKPPEPMPRRVEKLMGWR